MIDAKTRKTERTKREVKEIEKGGTSRASEDDVIRLAQQGNVTAFESLYRRHSRRVYGLCLRLVSNPTEAEDVMQDVFLQVFRKIHTFRAEASFSTWLHRLTVNAVLMRFRKRKHAEIPIGESTFPDKENTQPVIDLSAPDLRLDGLIDRLNLQRVIDRLPDGYKQMFLLHDVEGYEHNEIAQILGCSIGNSKSQLYKARLRLRDLLRQTSGNSWRYKQEAPKQATVIETEREIFA